MLKFLKKDITPYILAAFALIVIISSIVTYNRPLSYSLTISDKPTVNLPVTVDILIEKRMVDYSPTNLNVELTHKYNSNETYSFDLNAYDVGKYQFIFTPQYSGEYILTLTLDDDNTTQYFTQSITIGQ